MLEFEAMDPNVERFTKTQTPNLAGPRPSTALDYQLDDPNDNLDPQFEGFDD